MLIQDRIITLIHLQQQFPGEICNYHMTPPLNPRDLETAYKTHNFFTAILDFDPTVIYAATAHIRGIASMCQFRLSIKNRILMNLMYI